MLDLLVYTLQNLQSSKQAGSSTQTVLTVQGRLARDERCLASSGEAKARRVQKPCLRAEVGPGHWSQTVHQVTTVSLPLWHYGLSELVLFVTSSKNNNASRPNKYQLHPGDINY